MSWEITGEYFENCNCDILCPCITSSLQGPADNERCQVPLIIHISVAHGTASRSTASTSSSSPTHRR